MKYKVFRILTIVLAVFAILLVVYLWMNNRNMVFLATIPFLVASLCQRAATKGKSNK